MIDWKRKLTSRKWWISIITLVSGLVLAFGGNNETMTTITGCIMSLGSAIAYTIGEGFADAAAVKIMTKDHIDSEVTDKVESE